MNNPYAKRAPQVFPKGPFTTGAQSQYNACGQYAHRDKHCRFAAQLGVATDWLAQNADKSRALVAAWKQTNNKQQNMMVIKRVRMLAPD